MKKISRWEFDEGNDFLNQIINKKRTKKLIVNSSPFGKVNETHYDLENIIFPENIDIKKIQFENVSFKKSRVNHTWIEKCVFENVIFDNFIFINSSDHGNEYINCSFKKTKFKGTNFGYDGTKFVDCVFKGSKFSKSSFIRAELYNCEFIECDLKGIDFNASFFKDCSFTGDLIDVWFHGNYTAKFYEQEFGKPKKKNKMENVSFENANLIDVYFTDDCDLSTVKIPKDGVYKIVNNLSDFLYALKISPNELNTNENRELKIFIEVLDVRKDTQKMYLFCYDSVKKSHGENVADHILKIAESGY